MIGLHLLVDGVVEEKVSRETVEKILNELPRHLDMVILFGPQIVKGVPENPGWTGFDIIDKSHIAIHTLNENNTVSVDVFSCKLFNEKNVIQYLKEQISYKEITTRIINREIL